MFPCNGGDYDDDDNYDKEDDNNCDDDYDEDVEHGLLVTTIMASIAKMMKNG